MNSSTIIAIVVGLIIVCLLSSYAIDKLTEIGFYLLHPFFIKNKHDRKIAKILCAYHFNKKSGYKTNEEIDIIEKEKNKEIRNKLRKEKLKRLKYD